MEAGNQAFFYAVRSYGPEAVILAMCEAARPLHGWQLCLVLAARRKRDMFAAYIGDMCWAAARPHYQAFNMQTPSELYGELFGKKAKESFDKRATVDAAVSMFEEYGLAENVQKLLYEIHGIEKGNQ